MQAKRKREEDKEKEEKIKNGINKYFNAKTTAPAPKAKVPPSLDAFPLHEISNTIFSPLLLQKMQHSWQTCWARSMPTFPADESLRV